MSLLCRWEKWDPAIVDHLFQVLHLGRGGTGLNGPGYSLLCCGIFIMLLRGFLLRHSLFGLFVKFCIFFPHFMYWIWNSFTSLVMLYSLGGRSLLKGCPRVLSLELCFTGLSSELGCCGFLKETNTILARERSTLQTPWFLTFVPCNLTGQ